MQAWENAKYQRRIRCTGTRGDQYEQQDHQCAQGHADTGSSVDPDAHGPSLVESED
jgi:hypothetical protein